MPRRASGGGLMRDFRRVRAFSYRAARTMGNWQPVVEGLATGNLDTMIRGLTRRGIRRVAGRAFSSLSFGKGTGLDVLFDVAKILLGRAIGSRGRW